MQLIREPLREGERAIGKLDEAARQCIGARHPRLVPTPDTGALGSGTRIVVGEIQRPAREPGLVVVRRVAVDGQCATVEQIPGPGIAARDLQVVCVRIQPR